MGFQITEFLIKKTKAERLYENVKKLKAVGKKNPWRVPDFDECVTLSPMLDDFLEKCTTRALVTPESAKRQQKLLGVQESCIFQALLSGVAGNSNRLILTLLFFYFNNLLLGSFIAS